MIILKEKDKINLLKLKNHLIDNGYNASTEVSSPGNFMSKGDVFYLWPVNRFKPIRLDLFGNVIEKIIDLDQPKKKLREVKIEENLVKTEDGQYPPKTFVVHPAHGIGEFNSVVTKKFNGSSKKFIEIFYAKEDKLYFPFERSAELMIYLGSRKPRLSRLHSHSWEKTKSRIKINLLKLAREIFSLYRSRSEIIRRPYLKDYSFLQILAKTFEYDLTQDQQRSLKEIITSLTETDFPQDYLLVGDVGFGKTEVAFRAAAVVLAAGSQVAILAPTTVLAAQHASLARQRFESLPVNIGELSRFTENSNDQTIKKINSGQTDLVIGTHALLSKKVKFTTLGLLIIDEEQRFGVEQKDKLKKFRTSVDVLSLSATPIPRTLFMSLSGLRNISLINQPPPGRLEIKTKTLSFDEATIIRACRFELTRGGQIYYIHNRVQSIRSVQIKLAEALKQAGIRASIQIAHGQMSEDRLAATMADFTAGKIDILISSTIVESGLDHPNANTLVVENAERFGLADLYQLRGRIGRRHRRAYAYFLIGSIIAGKNNIPKLSNLAKNRLEAITETSGLGGGWQLALKDLELRGAGNLLGREQHGFMEAIGLLLYSKLLKEAVNQVTKEQIKKHLLAKIKE